MRINHNTSALNTYRQLSANNAGGAKSLEKLSSGLRINRAGDDAAGLAISEKMRGQIRGLDQASRNAQDGISLIQTAEGALNETHSILQRMRELVVQAANDTNVSVDRVAIKTELDQLSGEIDRVAQTTEFNQQALLKGTFGAQINAGGTTVAVGSNGVTSINVSGMVANESIALDTSTTDITATDSQGNVQVITVADNTDFTGTLNFDKLGLSITFGPNSNLTLSNADTVATGANGAKSLMIGANKNQKLDITIGDMQATAFMVNVANLTVDSYANAQLTLDRVDFAMSTVSTQRATLGAWQNRLEHTINNLGTSSENLTASESRVRDVDMAKEMMEYTKNNILSQAATAMLAQANQAPQGVLQLLR